MGVATDLRTQLLADSAAVDAALATLKNALATRDATLASMRALTWATTRLKPGHHGKPPGIAETEGYTASVFSGDQFGQVGHHAALLGAVAAAGLTARFPTVHFPAGPVSLATWDARYMNLPVGHPG